MHEFNYKSKFRFKLVLWYKTLEKSSNQELNAWSFRSQELENLCDKDEPSGYFDMTLGHVEGRFFSLHKVYYIT